MLENLFSEKLNGLECLYIQKLVMRIKFGSSDVDFNEFTFSPYHKTILEKTIPIINEYNKQKRLPVLDAYPFIRENKNVIPCLIERMRNVHKWNEIPKEQQIESLKILLFPYQYTEEDLNDILSQV